MSSPPQDMIGRQIGQYKVVRQIGQGGMGVVYQVVHTQLELRAAVKVLRLDSGRAAAAAERFVAEARAASAVYHSSLVRIFDFGQLADGSVYMMMEFLDGQTLRERLARGPLALPQALRLSAQLAAALAVVHEARIVHGDATPSNVIVVADREAEGGERAKLLDFGIARLATELPAEEGSARLVGTPLYMSPEQCAGVANLDERSDVYSLGVVLYEMLTAQHPYDVVGRDQLAVRQSHLRDKPRPLGRLVPAAPANLSRLCHEMMAKDALTRPPMTQVRDRLKALLALPLGPPRAADITVTGEEPAKPPPGSRRGAAAEPELLRQMLGAVLVVEPDFEAFCLDHYPHVYSGFGETMDRAAKESLLLSRVNLDELAAQLRCIEPQVLVTLPQTDVLPRLGSSGQRAVQPPRAPFAPSWCIRRSEEETQAHEALAYHKPVVFFGPELCGKTWLLNSLLEYAREQKYRIASINLNLIDKPSRSTLALFLNKFAIRMCRELHLDTDEVERAFANPRNGPIEALNDVMCATVLPSLDGPIVLAIDNVDLIAEKPYQDEYFGLLRAWADSGGPLERLHLLLCISTAPALLMQDPHRSPFNLGDVIELPDFDHRQLAALAVLHGLACTDQELASLQTQIGGHPYLTRLVFYESYRRRQPLSALLARIADEPRGGVLSCYLDHLRSQLQAQPELLTAFRRLAATPAAGIDPALCRRLERAGLITHRAPEGGAGAATYRVRYRLYERLLP